MTDDTLTAAVARLRKWLSTDEPIKMEKDLCTVLAALESAQADARRYRWLRDRLYSIDFCYGDDRASVLVFEAPSAPLGPGLALDAAIDAAMKGEGGA